MMFNDGEHKGGTMTLMKNAKYTEAQLQAYADYIIADYTTLYPDGPEHGSMVVTFMPGSKYTRVVTSHWAGDQRSSHSFIDADGNIWKCAGWNAPAKNFTRGNIITPDFSRVRWTGAQ
jgi:hypothetical protein